MRILFVADGNLKQCGARYHFTYRRLVNGFIRNGHNVYFLSDTDTARAGNIFRSSKLGKRYYNNAFIETCHNFDPALIILEKNDTIQSESLRKVKSFLPHVKIVQYNVDPLFSRHNINMLKRNLSHVDATFVTTAGSILKGLSHSNGVVSFIPNPVDKSIDYPRCHERSDQKHDVFWSMRKIEKTRKREDNPRIEVPLFLENSGEVKIDYYGMNGKPELWNADYYQAIENAKMGLNLSHSYLGSDNVHNKTTDDELYLYSSDRISHYMGSGLLTLSTRDNKLEELFKEDKEMVFFSSKEELLEKVIYYKNNDDERQEIAKCGWEKSHNCFNERLVAKYIFEVAFRFPLSEDYAWPTETH
ncbi:MAG: glycosyltransferase family 1 protein [Thermodesulfovibrionia bacterium]|nr:glycosyltransferase family 1 protein [Thermodesulfovibrionia bacterium]